MHPRAAERGDEVVQVRTPHGGGVAEVGAVAAGVVVPPVWPVGAVAEVPAPARPREVVEGEQLHVGVLGGGEHLWTEGGVPRGCGERMWREGVERGGCRDAAWREGCGRVCVDEGVAPEVCGRRDVALYNKAVYTRLCMGRSIRFRAPRRRHGRASL